jgi:glycosyltransferase 2 family protein
MAMREAERAREPATSFDAGSSLRTSLVWGAGIAAGTAAVLGVLVALGVLDAAAILSAIVSIDARTLAAIFALSLANYALRALRWHVLTREVAPQIPLTQNMAYFATGFAFLLTPAKAGEVVRLWLLKVRHGVPYARSLGLMLIDRASDMVCLLAFAGLGLLSQSQHTGLMASLVAGLMGLVAMLASRRIVIGAIRIAHRVTGRRWAAPFAFALQAYRTLRKICRPPVMASCAALSLLAWSAQIAGFWLTLNVLGFEAGPALCAFVFAFAVLAGVLPIFPGGVGGAEAAMIALLVLAGMTSEAAVTATVVNRLATLWFALMLGLVVAPFVFAAGRTRRMVGDIAPSPQAGALTRA